MWLTDYRAQYGLTLEQLGGMIRQAGRRQDPELRVSDILLYRMETDPKFRTVPKLADLIAEACGATARQRDEMVLRKYRGTWKPPRRRKAADRIPYAKPEAEAAQPKPACPVESAKQAFRGARGVVRLSRDGEEQGRYISVSRAALDSRATSDQIIARCYRRYTKDEFKSFGHTFRFAEEWDKMTEAEREADLHRASGGDGYNRRFRTVAVVDRRGQVRIYDSMTQACAAIGMSYYCIHKRLRRAQESPLRACYENNLAILYASDWESMTPDAQTRIWSAIDELG